MKNSLNKISSNNSPKTSKRSPKLEPINKNLKEQEIELLKQFDLNYKYGPCYGKLWVLF